MHARDLEKKCVRVHTRAVRFERLERGEITGSDTRIKYRKNVNAKAAHARTRDPEMANWGTIGGR